MRDRPFSLWCVLLALAPILIACAAAAEARTSRPATIPSTQSSAVPSGSALRVAQRQLEELRSRTDRRYSPADLLKLAQDSSPDLKYAATMAAMGEAIQNRKVSVAQRARDLVLSWFLAEPAKIDRTLANALADAQLNSPAAVVAVRAIDSALSSGDLRAAHEFSTLLTELLPVLPEELQKHSKERLADLRMASSLHPPSASQPRSSTGLFQCLYLGRWKDHLQQVADGQNDLAACARRDIAAGDVRSRFAAAEAWWLSARGKAGVESWRIAARATQIYDEILPQLSGVDRELALSRKSEHFRRYLASVAYRQGVMREILGKGTPTRVMCEDLELARSSEDVPRSGAHVVYRGMVLAEFAGRYEFTLAGGSGLRFVLDRAELINSPTAYRKRSGERIDADLSPGLHSFEIEVWSNSSKPRLSVVWSTPAHPEPQPISASLLFNDPLATDLQ